MPNELELCTVAAIVGALIGGGVSFAITHKIDGAALAHQKQLNADEIAKINAASAKQLADALAKGQAAEGRVASLEQQYDTEVANHAKDNLDWRAKLLDGTNRVRVHVTACHPASTGSKGTAAASATDDSAASADLSPAVAASAFTVVDGADDTASRLRALQAYVAELQNDGYINK